MEKVGRRYLRQLCPVFKKKINSGRLTIKQPLSSGGGLKVAITPQPLVSCL